MRFVEVGEIRAKITADNEGYKEAIEEAKKKTKELTDETNKSNGSFSSLNAALRQAGMSSKEIQKINKELRDTNPEILENQLKRVRQQLHILGVDSEQIEKIEKRLRETRDEAEKTEKSFKGIESVISAIGAGAALAGLTRTIGSLVEESNKLYNSMTGLIEVSKGLKYDVDAVTKAAQDMAAEGIMSVAEASQFLKTALASGLELQQAINLYKAMADAAAFNRQAHYQWGEAIVVAMEGIKNGNSTLTDSVGVTKNLSVMQQEYAESIGKTVGQLTDAEKIQAAYNGFLKEAALFAGNAKVALDDYTGSQAKYNQSIQQARAALGDGLKPVLKETMDTLTPMIVEFAKWASENKELVAGLVTGTTTFLGFVAALSSSIVVINAVRAAMAGLNLSLGPAGWLITGLALLAPAFISAGVAASTLEESTMEQVNAQRQQIDELDNLIARFDQLKGKPEKTAEDMAELRDVQNQLAQINPELVSSYDDLGNALIDTSDKAKELSESMKEHLRLQAQAAYYDALENIDKALEKQAELQDELAEKQEHIRANEEGILHLKQEIANIEKDSTIQNKEQLIELLQQEIKGLEVVNSELANESLKHSEKLQKQTEYVNHLQQALDTWKNINREISSAAYAEAARWSAIQDYWAKKYPELVGKSSTNLTTSVTVETTTTTSGKVKTAEEIANEMYRSELKMLDYKRNLDQLSAQEEIRSLEQMLSKYGKYTDLRMDLEVRIHRLKKQIAAEQDKLIEQQLRNEENALRDSIKTREQALTEFTRYQLRAINDAKNAELKAIEALRKASNDYYDERIRAIDQLIAKEREQYADQDYEARLAELQARADLLSTAVSPEGRRERKEVLKQIERLQLEHKRELRIRELEQQKQSLQDEKRLRDEAFQNERSAVENQYDSLRQAFENFNGDITTLESALQQMRISSNEQANATILANMDSFVKQYKAKVYELQLQQMQLNSLIWHSASPEEKIRLANENLAIGTSLGMERRADGHWYLNGVRVYHSGKDAGGLSTFSYADRLLPNEITAILKRDEYVFTQQQLSSLLDATKRKNDSSVINIDMSVEELHLEDKEDIVTFFDERERVARRLQSKGEKVV